MNYIVAGATDIGIKKNTNQDSYRVKVMTLNGERMVFAILCDGMGGLAKGELASATLVQAFHKWTEARLPLIYPNELTDSRLYEEWLDIVTTYNEKIKCYGENCGIKMGTTVTAMLITAERYYILNVGDTRAYEIAEDIRVLTKDQTVVAREVELGMLTPEQAERDPRRSVLLQCVGATDTVYPDMFYGETQQNTVYMLCSDGFRHKITQREIHQVLHPDRMQSSEEMTGNMTALIRANMQRQETDNITVVAVRTF